ncbi:MAG: hypothetical protein Q8J80_10965 [Gallionella sp.]|nr:hypothetical protein [Gallionella sp.]
MLNAFAYGHIAKDGIEETAMNREHYLSKRLQSPPETDRQVEPESEGARAAQSASPVDQAEKKPTKTKAAGSAKPDVQTNR